MTQSPIPPPESSASPDGKQPELAPIVEGAPVVKQTERPHPLTPFIRGWLVLVAIILGAGRQLIPDGSQDGLSVSDLRWVLPAIGGVVVLAAAAGFVNWYFTRFVIDDEELRIETGALFKNSKQISFERLQSIDVIQPMAARIFGLAELRLEVGAGDSTAKLRYLSRAKATRLRDYLLARAHGEHATMDGADDQSTSSAFTDLAADDHRLVTIPPQRLVGGFLLSSDWLITVGIVVVLFVVTGIFDVVPYALPGLIPLVIGGLSMISRRVISQFNFTLAETGRGVRVTRGLTNLTSQSVPVDRIQGFKITQSILWRRMGWYRVDVDIIGYGSNRGDDNNSDATSVLLPVATAGELRIALQRVLPGVDLDAVPLSCSPKRVRWLRPLDSWTLAYGYDDDVIISEHGWLTHIRNVVPHGKSQSVRIEQGPLQRRMHLADVHVDTPRGPVHLVAQHLPVDAARELAMTQLERARTARARARQPSPGTGAVGPGPGEAEVLTHFGIGPDTFLGSGGESRVFALDESRVLRLFHGTPTATLPEAAPTFPEPVERRLAHLYTSWATTDIGIELPKILEHGTIAGRSFTIDRRMSGRDFSGWLSEAPRVERQQALISFLDAALQLHRLPLPDLGDGPRFARLLGDAPATFDSLAALLDSQIERAQGDEFDQLKQQLPDADGMLARLRADIAERDCRPYLVHGDLCPPNAFVSRGPDGSAMVTGIGDFSPHTLATDPLMDVTAAIAFLELEHYAEAAADAQWLHQVVVERLGHDVARWIDVYRRYYAVYFSMDVSLHPWCLAQLAGR